MALDHDAIRAESNAYFLIFNELVRAGFTEAQALQIISAMILDSIRRAAEARAIPGGTDGE